MRSARILTQSLVFLAMFLAAVNANAVTLADLNAYIQRAILTAQSQGGDTRQAVSVAMQNAMEQGAQAGLDPVVLQETLAVTALNTAKDAGVDMDQVAQGVQVAAVTPGPVEQGQVAQTTNDKIIRSAFGGADTFKPFSFSSFTPRTDGDGGDVGGGLGGGGESQFFPRGGIVGGGIASGTNFGGGGLGVPRAIVPTAVIPDVVAEIFSIKEVQEVLVNGDSEEAGDTVQGSTKTGSNSQ